MCHPVGPRLSAETAPQRLPNPGRQNWGQILQAVLASGAAGSETQLERRPWAPTRASGPHTGSSEGGGLRRPQCRGRGGARGLEWGGGLLQ